MYICGVTPYDFSHIGHARVYVAFDVLHRYLKFLGYEVNYVRNFTDIDDKIIKRANEMGEAPLILSRRFSEEFLHDIAELNCLPPTHEPRVSDHMEQIKDLITKILDNGHAYIIEGDVYFSVDTFLMIIIVYLGKPDDNRAGGGGRVTVDTRKRNPADFALWKSAKPGEPSWESPWGPGRPGWHIECSAMSAHYLSHCFDIHGGGKDLIFPHHENEIAQSRAACPQSNVKYWMHNGFVNRDNQKMSKSDNNFLLSVIFFLMRTHYRSDVNYSDKALDTASDRVFYIYQTLHDCEIALSPFRNESFKGVLPVDVKEQIDKFHTEYLSSMSDDLHTTTVLDDLVDLLKLINGTLKKFKVTFFLSYMELLSSDFGGKKQQVLILSLLALEKEVKEVLLTLGLSSSYNVSEVLQQLKDKALKRAGYTEEEEVLLTLGLSSSYNVSEVLQQLKDKALKRAGYTEEEVGRKIEERNMARKSKRSTRNQTKLGRSFI
ncbi:hypothetical protein HPP92_008878 [Vanilla planifolia]|uniref:cysteine--tRNA ligase n=1 Tax=Vanilla planifolia TaxID=51239 RepID=A0A835R9L4_VANPL|nr:hypothetical protein HPP92_008878 [Vanilla planifolia]